MMTTTHFRKTMIAASLALIGGVSHAQSTPTGTDASATTQDASASATPSGDTTSTPNAAAATRLIARFSAFAGSEENAASLVHGLRTGSEVTLTDGAAATGGGTAATTGAAAGSTAGSTTPAPAPAGTTSFTPPTRPMGYGNVKIALSLAEAQLAAEGITQPTAQQLQAALVGAGTSGTAPGTAATAGTQTPGVLQMRASGMGWGEIANTMGFKLGTVVSGRATAAAVQPAPVAAPTSAASSRSIVTATGAQAGGHANSHGRARNSGTIVTAGGTAIRSGQRGSPAITAAGAPANAHGAGLAASSRASTAQGAGHGNGNAYGRNK